MYTDRFEIKTLTTILFAKLVLDDIHLQYIQSHQTLRLRFFTQGRCEFT